ncbi:peptidoglycan-binding protein [Streptomyces sp. NPDC057854]|uniref:peptidoglycan-binding protein n=1 Tax=unclassified Streptomyces TaxID=2593676 RepID=UPI0036B1DF91
MSSEAMIKKMESLLGTVGRPNIVTNWYADRQGEYYRRAPWCDMTITWAAYTTGNYEAVSGGSDDAYTVSHAQEFKNRGQWHTGVAGIQRGDIVFFDWDGSNSIAAIDHVGIVTGVNGRDILTIEGNTADRVARRVRHADSIAGYGRPAYPAEPGTATYTAKAGDTLSGIGAAIGVRWQDIATLNGILSPYTIGVGQVLLLPGRAPAPTTPPAPPAPPPPAPPPPAPVGAGVSLANLEFGDRSDDVRDFQAALKAKGFDPGPVDGVFGDRTKAACAAFQRSQGWSGDGADGLPGPQTIERLGLRLVGGAAPRPAPPAPGEPAHDYRRVTYGGKRVNQRTKVMLERAAADFGWAITLTQGSYNPGGVAASAGTHDGGGVVDISVSGLTPAQRNELVQCLRRAGLVAWLRVPPAFDYHIHAVAIGDREMSPAARSQIQQWREDRDGLARRGPDPAPDPYPAWTQQYR